MWVYSISPPSLSLIGSLTTEIYYRTEKKNWKHRQTDTSTHTHTNTHIHRDWIWIFPHTKNIGSNKNFWFQIHGVRAECRRNLSADAYKFVLELKTRTIQIDFSICLNIDETKRATTILFFLPNYLKFYKDSSEKKENWRKMISIF